MGFLLHSGKYAPAQKAMIDSGISQKPGKNNQKRMAASGKMKFVFFDAIKRFNDNIKYIDLNFLGKNKVIIKIDKTDKQVSLGGI